MDEFIEWYCSEPRLSFSRTVVVRYRMHLESRKLAPGTVNPRLGAVRRLAYEASDCGLLSPDLAAGIRRVRCVKKFGMRLGNWLTAEQGETLWQSPDIAARGLRNPFQLVPEAQPSGVGLVATPIYYSSLPTRVLIGFMMITAAPGLLPQRALVRSPWLRCLQSQWPWLLARAPSQLLARAPISGLGLGNRGFPANIIGPLLKQQFQGKLQVPRQCVSGATDHSESRRTKLVSRHLEVRGVGDVKRLGPELQFHPLP
jgi:hypothetical protein